MSRIAQPALAAAAIVAAGSALPLGVSLATDLEIYQEKNSSPARVSAASARSSTFSAIRCAAFSTSAKASVT